MTPDQQQANARVLRRMLLVVVGMFAFGFALIPLYDVFCDITGLGGRTGRIDAQSAEVLEIDRNRTVTVQFVAIVNENLPWEFRPLVKQVEVHPGEMGEAVYLARNRTDHQMVGQAIPSMTPGIASKYFNKLECFCFNQQTLAAGEAQEMPIRFVVDPRLPKDINTVTLAYTFFDLAGKAVN